MVTFTLDVEQMKSRLWHWALKGSKSLDVCPCGYMAMATWSLYRERAPAMSTIEIGLCVIRSLHDRCRDSPNIPFVSSSRCPGRQSQASIRAPS